MKKILVLILAIVFVFTLAACNGNDSGSGGAATPTPAAGDGGPHANADGSVNLNDVAFYDRDFDYTKNGPFKLKYLTLDNSPLYDDFNSGYEHWSSLMNIQFDGMWSCLYDNDLMLQQIQTCADQGYDAIIIDPDTTTYPAIIEVLKANPQLNWIAGMAGPRDTGDPDEPKIYPSIGFDFFECGQLQMEWLMNYAQKEWPGTPLEEIGIVVVDFSVVQALHDREVGLRNYYFKNGGIEENFITLDGVSGSMDADTARNLAMPVVSTNTKFTHWLAAGVFDDYSVGLAAAFDALGLNDKACVTVMGGSTLIRQWDAGQDTAWRSAYFTQQNIYAEPILGALYAFMSGYATPENIWPKWIDVNDHGREGDTYASLLLPGYWLEKDTYKNYLAWSDMYASSSLYPYPQEGISLDDFSARADVPDYYSVVGPRQ